MEKKSLYLEVAGKDTRRGLHKSTDRLENRWRDWFAQQNISKFVAELGCSVVADLKT